MKLTELNLRLRGLSIFRGLLADPVVESLCACLDALKNPSPQAVASAYGELVFRLCRDGTGELGQYLQKAAEDHENVYIQTVGRGELPPDWMTRCLEEELRTLQAAATLTPERLQAGLKELAFLPHFDTGAVDIPKSYYRRLENIGRTGCGIYARYHMFYLDACGNVVPVRCPDQVRLCELVDYQREKHIILDNTRALLAGRPAANVLLTGDAGTGKSSTVKAVVNELYPEGLRIIEVRKEQLREIPGLLDRLSTNPLKFILFIDDLSFQKGDDSYSALKAVLEGSVSAKSRNVVIYATSNRRHLVKEAFSDREGDDVHRGETMQEIVSLSERFGLHIAFQKPDKATYLHIVRRLAEQRDIDFSPEQLDAQAERFALGWGSRSPRAARQFIDALCAGETAKNLSE